MNGIEVLYKAMNDPELELKKVTHEFPWYSYREYVIAWPKTYLGGLDCTEYEIRKKESNLDKAVNEMNNLFSNNQSEALAEILSKYIKD